MPSLPVGTSPAKYIPAASSIQAQVQASVPAPVRAVRPSQVDSFEPAPQAKQARPVAAQAGTRPADGLKAYEELSPKQQALLGENGAARYASLSSRERAAFMVLTTRMEQNGLDYSGLKLKPQPEGIQSDRLMFDGSNKEALKKLEDQLRAGIAKGDFKKDKPQEKHHPGMTDFGARQATTRESMQVGLGRDGAFVDVDRFGPTTDVVGFFGHIGEVLTPGKTDIFKVAKALKIDVSSKLPEAK